MSILSFAGGVPFLPHGYCLAWDPLLVGTDVGASALIAAAYYSIPLALLAFVRRNPSLHFNGLFAMFSLFIFACGSGHVLDIVSIWTPVYRLELSVKVITAAASLATAALMWPLLPRATALLRAHRSAGDDLQRANDELRASHEALSVANERFHLTLHHAPIGLATVAIDGSFVSVNRALCEMLGYAEGQLLTKTFQELTHPDDLPQDLAYVTQLLDGERDAYRMEKRYLHRFGHVVYIQLDVSLLRSVDGRPVHFIAQIQDITQRIEQARALEHRALTDELTRLPNRRAFADAGSRLLAQARRSGETVGLLMLDIDHFKAINDRHGHAVGDAVLRAIKDIVEPQLRASDVLARLGGEEFAVLLSDSSALHAQQVAERLRVAVAAASLRGADAQPLPFSVSIGVATAAAHETLDTNIARADRAMYRAKAGGRNGVAFETVGT